MHTHTQAQDEYGVYGVVMVAPSVTPYTNNNPAFRIYTMDLIKDTLLGYDQYFLNLTKANGERGGAKEMKGGAKDIRGKAKKVMKLGVRAKNRALGSV